MVADDDLFMAIYEGNDEPHETSTNKAATSKESKGGNSAAATVNYAGFTADARFPQPMIVSPPGIEIDMCQTIST